MTEDKGPEELIPAILEKKEAENNMVDSRRSEIAKKLTKIMGVQLSYFRDWDLQALQTKYEEQGGEVEELFVDEEGLRQK